ncbi:unnamed protein product [Phyllotreta striolata]|uniref:Uncharacterized protein n=1 Tax=Phyllotreta striolata TaxID=444603 RepID=A0A9N9TW12_PHYSR|nr:unnamed protein product [Phyllotreta striolata]
MVHFYLRVSVFLLGVLIGIFLAKYPINVVNNNENVSTNPSYDKWLLENKIKRNNVIWDRLRYGENVKSVIESDFLFKKVPVTCLIILKNYKNEEPIRNTWAKGCNELKFIKIPQTRSAPFKSRQERSSWMLLCNQLQDLSITDWVFIVNDYSFVIMENLRYYVAPLDPNDKHYLGHAVEFWTTQFNSKNGGILLSRGSIEVIKSRTTKANCSSISYLNREDFYLGKTMATLGISPNDTRDNTGLSRFLPFNLNSLLFNNENHLYKNAFPFKCCSKNSITFQALDGDKMYLYYYLLYTMQVFHYGQYGNKPNSQDRDDEIWKRFLRERNIFNDNISSEEYFRVWVKYIDNPSTFAAKLQEELSNNIEL